VTDGMVYRNRMVFLGGNYVFQSYFYTKSKKHKKTF